MTTQPRTTMLQRLENTLAQGTPVIGAGVGTGLVAKAAAAGGADFLVVYCTSVARHRGFPTSIIGDPNTMMLDLLPDVIRAAGEVPVVAGVQATDPARDTRGALLDQVRELGCSGVINYPSMGLYGREYIGGPTGYADGLEIEHEMLAQARERGLVSITYSYRSDEAAYFADVADIICAHAGWTSGGLAGATQSVDHDAAAAEVTAHIEAARAVDTNVMMLAHGGPYARPDDTTELYRRTAAQGFIGASSIERIPVEEAVARVVQEFKGHTLAARG